MSPAKFLDAHPLFIPDPQTARQKVWFDEKQEQDNLLMDMAWRPYDGESPFTRDGGVFICDNGDNRDARGGICQTVVLDQQEPQPLVASVFARPEGVSGLPNADYALHVDVIYADGETAGHNVSLKTGSRDWQFAEMKIFPDKPVREVRFQMLLRWHAGKTSFRKPRLSIVSMPQGTALLDGIRVKPTGAGTAGFWVRDVASNTGYHSLASGQALGLKFEFEKTAKGDAEFFTGRITNTLGIDRAITLIYASPISGDGWNWLAGPRHDVPASRYENAHVTHYAGVGACRMSLFPLAAVSKRNQGKAIALDMGKPAFFRVGFAGGSRELYIAYDFGLAKEKPSAEFSFCTFPFAGREGFRDALAKFYEIFPEQFRCRTTKQGLWMPFESISKIPGHEDFGFRFKEGTDEVEWDDEHGINSFRYTEPMTYWMPLPNDTPRTREAALAEAERRAAEGDKQALALLSSGFHDESGRLAAQFTRLPWCDGAAWSVNSSPAVRGDVTDFKNKWNAEVKGKLYGEASKGHLDGEYLDSIEGYATVELNFRRDHLAAARESLTFSAENFQPAIFRGLVVHEYTRALSDELHAKGKLIMANDTPKRLCWLAPLLDVMGIETDWNSGGKWVPMPDDELLYRRVMCGPKPYCFLMNTNFAELSHELVEKYMKRCVAYGVFPGFFSGNAFSGHYFSQPELYERDRDLFKKYVPLCRIVAEAGWRPVTGARCNDPKVYVERFGEKYLTVFNDSGERKEITITLTEKSSGKMKELVSGADVAIKNGKLALPLDAEDVAVLVQG